MHKYRECEDASTWSSFFLPCFAYQELTDQNNYVILPCSSPRIAQDYREWKYLTGKYPSGVTASSNPSSSPPESAAAPTADGEGHV